MQYVPKLFCLQFNYQNPKLFFSDMYSPIHSKEYPNSSINLDVQTYIKQNYGRAKSYRGHTDVKLLAGSIDQW